MGGIFNLDDNSNIYIENKDGVLIIGICKENKSYQLGSDNEKDNKEEKRVYLLDKDKNPIASIEHDLINLNDRAFKTPINIGKEYDKEKAEMFIKELKKDYIDGVDTYLSLDNKPYHTIIHSDILLFMKEIKTNMRFRSMFDIIGFSDVKRLSIDTLKIEVGS